MKVSVSIPDPVFAEADLLAKRLRASRSEIYTRALDAFINAHAPDRVPQRTNPVVDSVGAGSASDDFARAASQRVLDSVEW